MNLLRFAAPALALSLASPLGVPSLSAQAPSPQMPSAPTTAEVLVTLTVKPEMRAQVPPVMPSEVRETVRMYLDGHIQQWYGRSDGKGVVFIMNCTTVAEAKALMESLPLAKNHLVDLDYMPLGPLTPLRALIGPPPGAQPAQ